MKTWDQFVLEATDDGAPLPRMPMTARIRRKVTVPERKIPQEIKDFYGDKYADQMKDKPSYTADFEPTHRNRKMPELTAQMIGRPKGGVVKLLFSYGGTGSEPISMFDQNWEPILAPGQN